MYAAKDAGRNRYAFYTEELGGNALAFVALESRLRKAIDDAQLRLFYQPQFRLRDGALIGVEALIRWPGAQPEHRSPAVFIPVAEMSGLIEPLGHWVLEEACGQIVQWQQAGFDFGQVAINLSCRQLNNPLLAERVKHILAGHRVDGSLLEFEITESMVVKEGGIAHANLEAFNGALR
jgi:EAL domain-containing protein (putative c-di-GMP-specific phosphodiesterase class I)